MLLETITIELSGHFQIHILLKLIQITVREKLSVGFQIFIFIQVEYRQLNTKKYKDSLTTMLTKVA